MTRTLTPSQLLYAVALRIKNVLLDHHLLTVRRLGWPVISIGNLSTGGSGKTPFALELARLLQADGAHVDILSRGYGRRSPLATERVLSPDARRYGDEPALLAHASGAAVYVGASRFRAGLLAEQEAETLRLPDHERLTHAHLLDDGFQHRKLARDADIVLLHPRDLHDGLLPTGRLREPFSALARADFIVLRDDDASSGEKLTRLGIHKPIWRVRRTLRTPPVQSPVVAFAAIAHPEEFFAQLRAAGLQLAHTFAFRDHHRFTREELLYIARAAPAGMPVLTTAKDMVRLSTDARHVLTRDTALHQVPLQTELIDAPRCLLALRAVIATNRASQSMRK